MTLATLFRERRIRRTASVVAATLLASSVSLVVLPAPAQAAAGITLSKTGPTSVLADGTAPFTLTAANPASNPTAAPEYNLSFRDVLPLGATYVAGSTTPGSFGEPTIVVDAGTGQQILVWRNVGDLQVADSVALGFRAKTDPTVLPVGAAFANTGSAYANTDPRRIPAFSATGQPVVGSYTETASASTGVVAVSALTVTKSEPSPEGELLRGVHDQTTVYSVRVDNTPVAATTSVVVVDYIPAALEFLGCGGVDNSAAREYPGAPSLAATPAVPGCVLPDSVTTVSDPPAQGTTTYPPGVYTRVQWTIGTMAPGATVTLRYAAGIPLRRNTIAFPGGAPSGASLGQTANLDNNTGSSTRETATEASATNIARATGTYTGPVSPGGSTAAAADDRTTVSIEDVRMRKTASTGSFTTGGRVKYTVTIDTSEYASADQLVVTDLIPNGMCPLGAAGANYVPGEPIECTGQATLEPEVTIGASVSPLPFDSVVLNGDGTFTVRFSPLPSGIPTDGTAVLTYWAGMRSQYSGGDPTSGGDSFTNTVSLTATTAPRPGTGETGTTAVTDSSSATIGTDSLTIDKQIGPRTAFPTGSGPLCGTDGAGYGEPDDFAASATRFGKGDIICFKLRVDFPDTSRTRNPVVTDFLPVGTEYVAGSAVATSNNLHASSVLTDSPDSLTWVIGDPIGTGRYPDLGAVFEWVFAVTVTDAAPIGTPDLLGNAMKLRAEDSSGRGRSYRDNVDFTIVPAVPVGIVKGVAAVDSPAAGPNGVNSNVDGLPVREGSRATFRIDVTNTATPGAPNAYGAGGFDIWDVLPDKIRCAQISNIAVVPPPGPQVVNPAGRTFACTDPGDLGHPTFAQRATRSAIRIVELQNPALPLAAQGIAPGQTWSYTYDMVIPSPTAAGFTFVNTASIRSYTALTNVPTSRPGLFAATYYPQSNVDTTVPTADQDAPAASDPSNVVTPAVAVSKAGTTSINETNNNLANQASIGEVVTYQYAATIPPGTSVFDASLTDALPTGFALTGAAPTLEYCPDAPAPSTPATYPLPSCLVAPVAPPANVTINASGTVSVAGTFDNATANRQRFLVTATVLVTNTAINATQNAIARVNTATFAGRDAVGGAAVTPVTATYSVNVRQPQPSLVKTNNRPGTVTGDDLVTYTLTAYNRTSASDASNRPPLHDAFIVDCLPVGLVFDAYGANAGLAPVPGDGTNGCPTGTTRLVWSLGTVAPSTAGVTRTYTARVSLNAVGGDAYTNSARLTGSTLNDGKPTFDAPDNANERTYSTLASSLVTVSGGAITKAVDRATATIGETATYTVTATIPINTNFYEFTVLDLVPAGMSAPTNLTYSCVDLVTSLSCGTSGSTLAPTAQPGGATRYGFLVGDFLASPNQRRETITYTSTVLDVPANAAAATRTDTVQTAWFAEDGRTPTTVPTDFQRLGGTAAATVTLVEPGLSIAKSVDDTTPDPGQSFQYTVRVTNASGATVSSAYDIAVSDVVPAGVVVDAITGGGTISGADPVTGGGTITWTASSLPGPLAPGASATLTYTAHLAPSATLDATALVNRADVDSYRSLAAGGRTYTGPSTTASVTPQFPRLVTAKAATGGAPAYIGDEYAWTVTVTNTGGARADAVRAVDVLPPGWTYVAGSAQVTVAGGPTTALEPTIGASGASVRLDWAGLGSLAPGQNLTIAYRSVPGPGVVSNPGVGASVAQTNTANSFGDDATGASGNGTGDYGDRPATASTRIDSADVRVVKSHGSPPVAGADFDWTITVSNAGPDTAVGPFVVTDTVQGPTTFVSAGGSGWSCSNAGSTVTCSRTNPSSTLAAGTAFPPITLTVAVPAGTNDGATLTNTAAVTARTYDPETTNNSSTDTAAVITRADLAITKTHAGDVVAGLPATYTLDVVNNGPSVSRGPITVTDTLPSGSTFVSATGTDWVCAQAAGELTCSRASDLAPGAAAPQIVVVVDIPSGQTATVVNTAIVTGTTTDPVPGNNTSEDRTPPSSSADLSIQKRNTAPVAAGTTTTYRFTVDNIGPSDARTVVVTDTLPAGLTYAGTSTSVRGSWSCSAAGQLLTCTLAGALAADPTSAVDGDAVVEVDIDVASDVVGTVTNTAEVDSTTPDPNPGNNSDTDTTEFDVEVDLAIAKSHSGAVVAGRELTWVLSVDNNGPSDSPGPIVVTDGLPDGTSYLRFRGTGWDCTAAGQVVTCERTAGLASGATAPDIEIDVLIADDAGPATLRNTASVDGPADDPDPGNNTAIDDIVVTDRVELTLTKTTTGPDPVRAGETTEFTIAVTNAGPSTADSVVVTDTLPAGLTPISASGPGWTCPDPVGQLVRCTRDTLAPATRSIVVSVRVDSSVLQGTTLTNTATVDTTTPGDDPDDNTDSSDVRVIARADLVLTKSHASVYDQVAAGERATFDIAVRNDGPSDAQPDLVVTDTLPEGLTFVSSTGPWDCVAGTPGPAGQDVTCTWTDGVALSAGSSAPPLTMTVDTDPSIDAGDYTNTATVDSPTVDPTPGNNTDTDDLTVTTLADLSIVKSHTGSARVGDELEFTLEVANAGPSQARRVVVTDPLPTGVEYVSADGTDWTCAEAAGEVTCELAGRLDPGASAPPITLTVRVLASAYPSVTNTATVDSTTPERDPADNTDSDVVPVPALVDLAITKTHTGTFQVGGTATYTLTVTNAGPTSDPGPLTITDPLPTGLSFVSGGADGWSCSAVAALVTCERTAALGVGESTSLPLTVQVLPAAVPSVLNVATVSTPSEETDITNNTATDPADVAPLVELGLVKRLGTFDVADMRATWVIAVTNNGPNASQAAIIVTDVLPAGLSFVSASGTGWVCDISGRTVTCRYAASLPVGGTVAFRLVTDVTAADGATVVNEAQLSGNVDPNPDNDSSAAQLDVPDGGTLPRTGADVVAWGLVGLVLVALGVAVVGTTRRRPETSR